MEHSFIKGFLSCLVLILASQMCAIYESAMRLKMGGSTLSKTETRVIMNLTALYLNTMPLSIVI